MVKASRVDGWAGPCLLPEALVPHHIVHYDAECHQLRAAASSALAWDADDEWELEQLHKKPITDAAKTAPALHRAQVQACLAKAATLDERKRQKKAFRRHVGWRAFCDAYHTFVREVVLPQFGGCDLLVQSEPVLRCVLPGSVAPCQPHCDADYYHDPSELNFWVPLTPVSGSNSLFCESSPGRGDFAPFVLGVGQAMRFYGNRCRHYTTPNEPNGAVRVSFDFRVIPAHLAHSLDEGSRRAVVRSPWRLADGGYYRLLKGEGGGGGGGGGNGGGGSQLQSREMLPPASYCRKQGALGVGACLE
jgi:hypothetical protein